ncbi:MAG: hypothetical protein ACRDRJ_09190 [Streptosporangiaceae bacterium]
MAMEGLGRVLDISQGWTPQDFHADGITGAWVSLKRASGVLFVVQFKAGTSGANATLTLQEATDAAGDGNQDLAVIDHYYLKKHSTPTDDLTGVEVWAEVTQDAAATVTATAADYELLAIPVLADQLDAGFSYLNLSAGTTADAQYASSLAILHDLLEQRAPASLAAPGA